jgi:hypothetical protein
MQRCHSRERLQFQSSSIDGSSKTLTAEQTNRVTLLTTPHRNTPTCSLHRKWGADLEYASLANRSPPHLLCGAPDWRVSGHRNCSRGKTRT